MTNGLIVAEAVMMGLAPYIGRQDAHDVVYDACRIVNEQGGRLADVLNALPAIASRLQPELIEQLTDPTNYLGMAPQNGGSGSTTFSQNRANASAGNSILV
ncbi:3-carboxy-cis,cis-muconate cycloisomerase [Serratia fonticola]|uniref:3-carboxy-cis,cis-muconate cycloisomerase n=1 Tax=Serratia fonticola TaxID=47917 RepID=A0A4U9WMU1_SERFO|nr:3-carboxy-cis,cis-muconate cycloisomerase [Serratia fonticola]